MNVWDYSKGNGPSIDGTALDFVQVGGTGWQACSRSNINPPDSIGVSVTHTYHLSSGLGSIMRFFGGHGAGQILMSDDTVMALNPTNT